MISQLIAETGEQLAAYQQYEKDKNIKQKIQATQTRLDELQQKVATFANDFRQVADVLEPDKRQYIQNAGSEFLHQLVQSQRDFKSQPNQASSLSGIVRDLHHLQKQLHSAWHLYTREQIKPRRELYSLVSSFPEIAQHEAKIISLFQRLDQVAESFPASLEARKGFHTQLEHLDHYLEKIHVPDTVRQFLEQVRENQFTVADLNDEILAWCREGKRGRVFKITF